MTDHSVIMKDLKVSEVSARNLPVKVLFIICLRLNVSMQYEFDRHGVKFEFNKLGTIHKISLLNINRDLCLNSRWFA